MSVSNTISLPCYGIYIMIGMLALFTGSIYGAVHTVTGHPLDTVKSRMQMDSAMARFNAKQVLLAPSCLIALAINFSPISCSYKAAVLSTRATFSGCSRFLKLYFLKLFSISREII